MNVRVASNTRSSARRSRPSRHLRAHTLTVSRSSQLPQETSQPDELQLSPAELRAYLLQWTSAFLALIFSSQKELVVLKWLSVGQVIPKNLGLTETDLNTKQEPSDMAINNCVSGVDEHGIDNEATPEKHNSGLSFVPGPSGLSPTTINGLIPYVAHNRQHGDDLHFYAGSKEAIKAGGQLVSSILANSMTAKHAPLLSTSLKCFPNSICLFPTIGVPPINVEFMQLSRARKTINKLDAPFHIITEVTGKKILVDQMHNYGTKVEEITNMHSSKQIQEFDQPYELGSHNEDLLHPLGQTNEQMLERKDTYAFSLASCLRAYQTSPQTFLDLVEDESPPRQLLQLWLRTRRLGNGNESCDGEAKTRAHGSIDSSLHCQDNSMIFDLFKDKYANQNLLQEYNRSSKFDFKTTYKQKSSASCTKTWIEDDIEAEVKHFDRTLQQKVENFLAYEHPPRWIEALEIPRFEQQANYSGDLQYWATEYDTIEHCKQSIHELYTLRHTREKERSHLTQGLPYYYMPGWNDGEEEPKSMHARAFDRHTFRLMEYPMNFDSRTHTTMNEHRSPRMVRRAIMRQIEAPRIENNKLVIELQLRSGSKVVTSFSSILGLIKLLINFSKELRWMKSGPLRC